MSERPHVPGTRQYWLFALIFLLPAAVAAFAATYAWASPMTLLSDPFKISESLNPLHPMMGALSSFGAIMFFCSSAVALFGATLATERSGRHFLIYAGLFSSLLGIDDFFGLHDRVFPEFSIDETYVELLYVVGQLVYIIAFREVLLRLNYILLAAALLLLAISLALDSRLMFVIQDALGSPLSQAAAEAWEDLPKLAGTVLWLWFHMQAAKDIVADGRLQDSVGHGRQGNGSGTPR